MDASGNPIQITPAKTALAATYDATISSATSITLQATTTLIEVTAVDKGIFLRWAAGAASNAFDEFIPANSSKCFARPYGVTVLSVIEQAATAIAVVIEK